MSSCSVASCRNHRRSTILHKKDVSYHRFPKNDDIREKWLRAVLPRKDVTGNHYVCSVHFLEDDFERNLQAEMLNLPKKRRLKPTAVPSLYMDEPNKGDAEDNSQEITYDSRPEIISQNTTASVPDIKYKAVIQRIDTLGFLNFDLLASQNIISLDSKSGLEEEASDNSSNSATAVVVPTSNLTDDMRDAEWNSITNPEIFLKAESRLRCRTCLEGAEKYYFLTHKAHTTNTVKEMIILCIPQMASTLSDDDVICDKCLEAVQFCVKFIESCLEVEEKLQAFNVQEAVAEHDEEDSDSPDVGDCIQIDHDYVLRSEPEQAGTFQNSEDTQPSILKSLLVNLPQQEEPTQQTFKCPACDRLLKSQKLLANHIRRVHNLVDSNISARSYPQVEEFLQITDRERFKCWNCGKLFRTENYLLAHLRRVHNLPQEPPVERKEEVTDNWNCEKKYVCKFCSCSFARPSTYKLHLKRHIEEESNVCRVCGLKFGDKQSLMEHRREHGIICRVCFQRFSTRKEIIEHRETHPNIFFCKVCGKGFKVRSSLTSHAEVHNAHCFYCSECGKGFKTISGLRYHEIIHDPEKKLKCDKCPSTFQDKTKLNLHQRVVHEKVREWKCDKCDKRFGLKISLKYHNRLTHLKLKTYQCENCGKRFGRRDYLKRHKLSYCKELKKDVAKTTVEVGSVT